MPARSPEDLWQQLIDEAGDDLAQQAAAVSIVRAERDLAAAGFDVAAERAVASARIASLRGHRK